MRSVAPAAAWSDLGLLDPISHRGRVRKRGHVNPAFQPRFFVLAAGLLKYYKTDDTSQKEQGLVNCAGMTVEATAPTEEHPGFEFTVTDLTGKSMVCSVPTTEERQTWISKLEAAAQESRHVVAAPDLADTDGPGLQAHASASSPLHHSFEYYEAQGIDVADSLDQLHRMCLGEALSVSTMSEGPSSPHKTGWGKGDRHFATSPTATDENATPNPLLRGRAGRKKTDLYLDTNLSRAGTGMSRASAHSAGVDGADGDSTADGLSRAALSRLPSVSSKPSRSRHGGDELVSSSLVSPFMSPKEGASRLRHQPLSSPTAPSQQPGGTCLETAPLEKGCEVATALSHLDLSAAGTVPPRSRTHLHAHLFHSCLGLPIRSSDGGDFVGVLVLFAPHAEEDSLELYYQRAHNTMLYDLLDSAAHVMGAALALDATLPSYRAAYDAKKAEIRGRARKMWFKMRIAVRCGWVKSGSDSGQGGHLSLVGPALEWFKAYLNKFKGAGMAAPPRADLNTIMVTFAGSFLGVGTNALIHFRVFVPATGTELAGFDDWQFSLMSGSFGALACLLYAMPQAPFSQPKMVICGHILALSVAVACDYFVNTRFATAFVPTWVRVAAWRLESRV